MDILDLEAGIAWQVWYFLAEKRFPVLKRSNHWNIEGCKEKSADRFNRGYAVGAGDIAHDLMHMREH